jgi:hypothetical protein
MNLDQIPTCFRQIIATFLSNFISAFVKALLPKSIIDSLGQFTFVRAKQPSAPILFDQK